MPDRIVAALREKFEIENLVGFDLGVGRMPRIVVTTPPCEAHIYLHGAHVTHYRHRGQSPLLFLSEKSLFQNDTPIRGGIPICWPWFGPNKDNPTYPMHGFARTSTWELQSAEQTPAGQVQLKLSLTSNDLSRNFFPHDFILDHTITIGDTLELALRATNTGDKPFTYEEALHTYFAVADIHKTQLLGLGNTTFTTKVAPPGTHTQESDPLLFTGETDSVYTNNSAECTIVDAPDDRAIIVGKQNSNSTVIWNPWIAKAKAMADFGDDEWPKMLCVETANVWDNSITLSPGQSHTMLQRITTRQLSI